MYEGIDKGCKQLVKNMSDHKKIILYKFFNYLVTKFSIKITLNNIEKKIR